MCKTSNKECGPEQQKSYDIEAIVLPYATQRQLRHLSTLSLFNRTLKG